MKTITLTPEQLKPYVEEYYLGDESENPFRKYEFEITDVRMTLEPTQYLMVCVDWESTPALKYLTTNYSVLYSGNRVESQLEFGIKYTWKSVCSGEHRESNLELKVGIECKDEFWNDEDNFEIRYNLSHFNAVKYGVRVYFKPEKIIGEPKELFKWSEGDESNSS